MGDYKHNRQFRFEVFKLNIAQALVYGMEAKGYSQRRLAEEAGLTCSHVSNILNGFVDIRLSTLSKLLHALDIVELGEATLNLDFDKGG